MSVYYLDTSAVVKRYVNEAGSDWVRALGTKPSPLMLSSRLLIVEIASALTRRLREKAITPSVFRESLSLFDDDCKFEYQLLDVTRDIINIARSLVSRHPLRSYDAIHLASALYVAAFFRQTALPAPIFLAADERLLHAALAEGLEADNPNTHAQ